MDGRGWGPAPNNVDRGSQLDEEDEEDEENEEEEEEEEKDEEEEKRKEEEEEETTDIKSNNPHLAGGEQGGWTSYTTQGENFAGWSSFDGRSFWKRQFVILNLWIWRSRKLMPFWKQP